MRGLRSRPPSRFTSHALQRLAPLLAFVALVGASPVFAATHDGGTNANGRPTTLQRTQSLGIADTAIIVPERADHRAMPAGWMPAASIVALVALAAFVRVRPRRTCAHRAHAPFRRRAPPTVRISA